MLGSAYDKKISDEVKRLNRQYVAHMKRVGRGISGGGISGGAGLADLLQIPMQMLSLPLKMLGLGGAVPIGAGISGGAMGDVYGSGISGGAGLADLFQLPMQLLSGILGGGNMPPQQLRFGSNPATWSPNTANYAKGGGVYGGFSSGGASSGGASSGGRKRRVGVVHRRKRGGALLQGFDGAGYDGGFSSGGRGPSAKSKAAAKHNPWIEHVRQTAADEGISYKEALKIAKHTYVKM